MTTTTLAMAARRPPPRAAAAVRVGFGLVWAIDAVLKWLPGFRSGFGSMLDAAAQGQPGWLRPWFDLWTGLPHNEASALAYLSAVAETAIAAALLTGFARVLTYVGGGMYSLLIWATAEGFGGPYRAGATDIGTGIIYAFVFLGLLALAALTGPDPYCLDTRLERRISWWWRVAEVHRPFPRLASSGVSDLSAEPPVAEWHPAGVGHPKDVGHGDDGRPPSPMSPPWRV